MMQINKEKKKILNKILSNKIIPPNYNITISNGKRIFKVNKYIPFHLLSLYKEPITNKIERKLYTTHVSYLSRKKDINDFLIELSLLDLQFIKNLILKEIYLLNESIKQRKK